MGLIRVNEPNYAVDGSIDGYQDSIVTKMFVINMRQLSVVEKNLYHLHDFPDFTQPLMIPTWTYVEPTQSINHVMGAAFDGDDKVFAVEIDTIRQRVLTEGEKLERIESWSKKMKAEIVI